MYFGVLFLENGSNYLVNVYVRLYGLDKVDLVIVLLDLYV